jgi:hypothetical protein
MDAASRLSRGLRRAQAPAAAAAAPAAAGAAANVVREAKGLKPRDLLTSDTHVALREWLTRFRIYYEASKFEHATDAMKHGYFYACMEDKLAFRVRSAATATSAVLNTPGDDPDPTSLGDFAARAVRYARFPLCSSLQAHGQPPQGWHKVHGLDEPVHR